jgi:hypothetical protein
MHVYIGYKDRSLLFVLGTEFLKRYDEWTEDICCSNLAYWSLVSLYPSWTTMTFIWVLYVYDLKLLLLPAGIRTKHQSQFYSDSGADCSDTIAQINLGSWINLWIMPSREFVLFPSQYRMNWMLSQIPTLFKKSKPKRCIAPEVCSSPVYLRKKRPC